MRTARALTVALLLLVACSSDNGDSADDQSDDQSPSADTSADDTAADDDGTDGGAVGSGDVPGDLEDLGDESGSVVYTVEGEGLFRIEARDGAEPENLSDALDEVVSGQGDEWVSASRDGDWLLVSSERFDGCDGWACVAVVDADVSEVIPVEIDGEPLHTDQVAALGADGTSIVYSSEEGPHESDLWVTTRDGDEWSAPELLTDDSDHDYNAVPWLSADGETVVFNCGTTPYTDAGTNICRVSVDGSDLTTLIATTDGPGGSDENALHNAWLEEDGSVVFEADWEGGESLWRVGPDGADPTLISDAFADDNSPCVLPNGRIVSLWLDRPDGEGYHELKVMDPEGDGYLMLLVDIDVADIGLSCTA